MPSIWCHFTQLLVWDPPWGSLCCLQQLPCWEAGIDTVGGCYIVLLKHIYVSFGCHLSIATKLLFPNSEPLGDSFDSPVNWHTLLAANKHTLFYLAFSSMTLYFRGNYHVGTEQTAASQLLHTGPNAIVGIHWRARTEHWLQYSKEWTPYIRDRPINRTYRLIAHSTSDVMIDCNFVRSIILKVFWKNKLYLETAFCSSERHHLSLHNLN